MEPFEIMVSESQERMLCVVRARAPRRGARACARSGRSTGPRSARSPTRGAMRVFVGDELVGDMPVAALVDDCPLYDLAPQRRRARRSTRRRAATLAPDASVARRAARAARLAEHRLAPAALRAVRLDRAVAHRAPARGGRRRGARAPRRRAIAVSIDGNGRRVAADPYRGTIDVVLECASNLACVGAEPLGHDEQPELRQPREAAHRLAAHRGRARPRRRLPRARRADRRRQRLALQRGPRAGRSTRRRSSGWSGGCPTPARRAARLRARGRRRRARRGETAAVAGAPASWPSCAASRCPTGCPTVDIARARAALEAIRDAVRARRAVQRARHRRGRLPRRGGGGVPGGRRRRDARPRRARRPEAELFGEGPGGFVVSGPRDGAATSSRGRVALDVFGTVGGADLEVSAAGERTSWHRGASCAPRTARWPCSSPERPRARPSAFRSCRTSWLT